MAIKDGRLEVVTAIADTTDLVTVDPTTNPPTVDPENLFDLTFNDERVGIDDSQMRLFKASLEELLPEITSDIERIPNNSNLLIDDVAEFVRLALRARVALTAMRRTR
jgi:hypothetical protein